MKESQEITQARRAADAASKKSLFEQLTDQQDLKKEEYDKNTKLIFGMSCMLYAYHADRGLTCRAYKLYQVSNVCECGVIIITCGVVFVCVQLHRSVLMRRTWNTLLKSTSATSNFWTTRSNWTRSSWRSSVRRACKRRTAAASSPLCSRCIRRRRRSPRNRRQ